MRLVSARSRVRPSLEAGQIVRYGVVGNISACHADARGSIPRFGAFFILLLLFFIFIFYLLFIYFYLFIYFLFIYFYFYFFLIYIYKYIYNFKNGKCPGNARGNWHLGPAFDTLPEWLRGSPAK